MYEKAKYFGADAAKETVTIADTIEEIHYVSNKLIEITKEQDDEWNKLHLPTLYYTWIIEHTCNYPSKEYTKAWPVLLNRKHKSIQYTRT